jgi:hypothetical protein
MVWLACSICSAPSAICDLDSPISPRISLPLPHCAAPARALRKPPPQSRAPAPGTRRLHRRIQRQDIGLERNALDGGDDLPHLVRGMLDALHHFPTLDTASPPCRAKDALCSLTFITCSAVSADWRTVLDSCSMAAAVSSRLQACCSVRADSWLALGNGVGKVPEAMDLMPRIPHHGPQIDVDLVQPLHQQGHGVATAERRQIVGQVAACNIARQVIGFRTAAVSRR